MNDKRSGHFASCPWCKKYSTICPLDTKLGDEYSIASCSNPSCNGTVLLCSKCPKFYKKVAGSGMCQTRILEHINKCHSVRDDSGSESDTDDDCQQLSKRDRDDSDDESDDDRFRNMEKWGDVQSWHFLIVEIPSLTI